MRIRALFFGVLLWLGGCAGFPLAPGASDPGVRARVLCAAYTSTLVSLGVQNRVGHISEEEELVIDGAVATLDPFCTGGGLHVTTAGALAEMELRVAELITIKEQAR